MWRRSGAVAYHRLAVDADTPASSSRHPDEPVRGWLDRAPAWRVAVATGLAGLLALVVVDAFVLDEPVPKGDDLIYELMAEDPGGTHTFPFAFRVAVPWLVHVLPFGHTFSFSALAWLCCAAAGAFLFLAMDRVGISRRLSVPLCALFVFAPTLLIASLRQGRNPDPMTALIMCMGAWCIVSRRPRALAGVMLVGAFNRESALILGPWAYAYWADRPFDRRALGPAVLATVPALAAYVALRLAIPTVGREQVLGYDSLIGGRLDVLEKGFGELFANARRIAYVAGPLWLGYLLALRTSRFARSGLVVLAFCVVSATFANDWGRVAFIAAPAVWIGAALVLERHRHLWPWVLASLLAMNLVYAVYMDRTGVRTGIIELGPPPYPVR